MQIIFNDLCSFAIDSIVSEIAIGKPQFSHSSDDFFRIFIVGIRMPIEMRPEMLSFPGGICLNKLFAYLGGKITHDGKMFLVKRIFKRRQLFFGYFQVFLNSPIFPPYSISLL